jgi:hypoxanthine phosphoribosyltransferase
MGRPRAMVAPDIRRSRKESREPMSTLPRVRVLFDEEAIARRNEALARAVAAAETRDLLVVAVLKGSFMFAADLIRALHRAGLSPQVEFIHLSSYRKGTVSSGNVAILRDVESEVRGRDVLLIDDVLESGRTLAFAKDLLAARGARRVLTAVLLEKPGKRAVTIDADFIGFSCPDVFVVGYGMDVAHSFRQLPFVGVVSLDGEPDLFGGT